MFGLKRIRTVLILLTFLNFSLLFLGYHLLSSRKTGEYQDTLCQQRKLNHQQQHVHNEKESQIIQKITTTSVPSDKQPSDDFIFNKEELVVSVYDEDKFYAFQFQHQKYTPDIIPPILHIEWKNKAALPSFAEETLKAWRDLHPDWKIMLWTDDTLNSFAQDILHEEFLKVYKSFVLMIQRVDLMRYVILYYYGGTYADIDQMPDQSLEPLRKHACIIAREPEPYFVSLDVNGALLGSIHFMMSRPRHPFWLHILHEVKHSKKNDVLGRTGPVMMTNALHLYAKLKPKVNFHDSVFVAPSLYFYPPPNENGDAVHLNMLREVCAKSQLGVVHSYKDKICQLMHSHNKIDWSDAYKHRRYHNNGSFGHHLMYHSWSGYPDIDVQRQIHIKSIIPDYLIYEASALSNNPYKQPISNALENEQKLLEKYIQKT